MLSLKIWFCKCVDDRLNASVLAVKNCKRKAVELAQAVGTRLGCVIAVREDFCSQSNDIDIMSASCDISFDKNQPVSVQERLQKATLHITAKSTVTFELRSHKHKDSKLY